jgi:hypothetical protein
METLLPMVQTEASESSQGMVKITVAKGRVTSHRSTWGVGQGRKLYLLPRSFLESCDSLP